MDMDKRIKIGKKYGKGVIVTFPATTAQNMSEPPVQPPDGYKFVDLAMGWDYNSQPPLVTKLMVEMDPLEKAWSTYWKEVDAFALAEFERVVKPWLKRHGYDFTAGNGTWLVSKDNPRNRVYGYDVIDEDQIPKRVLEVLQRGIDGMDGNDLGSLMPAYDYATDVQNNGEE